jgi:coiled-coil domain-containing protein 130
MIAKGVRFNAVKKKGKNILTIAGRYMGTIIFQFNMLCPGCKNEMVIKTDPENCEYLLVSGCIKYVKIYL